MLGYGVIICDLGRRGKVLKGRGSGVRGQGSVVRG
jgi:hypothetical protein